MERLSTTQPSVLQEGGLSGVTKTDQCLSASLPTHFENTQLPSASDGVHCFVLATELGLIPNTAVEY